MAILLLAPVVFFGGIGALVLLPGKPEVTSSPSRERWDHARTVGARKIVARDGPQPRVVDPAVYMDYRNGDLRIEGRLVAVPGSRPDTVWVWAYFINPGVSNGSWSDTPIPVIHPFAHGDTARFTARGNFGWWNNSAVGVVGGWRAHVRAGSTPGVARLPVALRDYGAQAMTPVYVRFP